jgi:hypothetical protein
MAGISLFPRAACEIRRIAGGKRFLEGFVYFFFQMPIFIVDFLVRSIRAHGIGSTNPQAFRLQSVCFFRFAIPSNGTRTRRRPTVLHARRLRGANKPCQRATQARSLGVHSQGLLEQVSAIKVKSRLSKILRRYRGIRLRSPWPLANV